MLGKLDKIPRVGAAGYDSGQPNAPECCLEDTQTAVLNKIWGWIGPPTPDTATDNPTISDTAIEPPVYLSSDAVIEPVYWVNGLVGIRKSTIACTVAEDVKHCKLLGMSFFSHQEKELSDPHLFVPTIAYQLAQLYPEARSVIINVFQHDPDIVRKSFAIQFKELIMEPLSKIPSKQVIIVVNTLDECDNSEGAANRLFWAIIVHCVGCPSLCLLITSRPETYIRAIITGAAGIVLHEDIDQSVVSADIHKYLCMEMSQIPKRLGIEMSLPWPSDKDLAELVERAGKLFIWAWKTLHMGSYGCSLCRRPSGKRPHPPTGDSASQAYPAQSEQSIEFVYRSG